MFITLAAIATFTGSTLSSYFTKKGLDVLLFSEPKFIEELNKTILETLEEFEKNYPQKNDGKNFPFYHSQRIINELLNYRVMQDGDYNPNDLLVALQSEPNVIPPTIDDIENFYKIFVQKIAANEKLQKLEIKQTFDKEIFSISRKLDDLKRNIENILHSFSADLENQWKSRLDAYSTTIHKFMPTIALDLLSALSKSLDEGNKKPTPEFLSLIEYQKGISLSFLDDKDATCKAFITAYKLNEGNIIFCEQAAMAYYKIGEFTSAIELAEKLLSTHEFNAYAWAVKILNLDIKDIEKEITNVPDIVKRDILFKKLLYNNYNRLRQSDAIAIMRKFGLIPSALEYSDIPLNINTYTEHIFWLNLVINEYFSSFYLNFSDVDDRNPALIKAFNNHIKKYLDAVKGTEIDKSNEELYFLYAYSNFTITKEKKYAIEMKERFDNLKNKDYLNLTLCANALQLSGEVKMAIELIELNFSEHREVLMLQSFCYLKNQDIDQYTNTNLKLLKVIKDISASLIVSHINTIIQLKEFGKLNAFAVSDFLENKEFESPEDESLTFSISSMLIDGSSDKFVQTLLKLTDFYKENPLILGLIADTLHFVGKNEEAVSVFRMFLNKDQEGRELLYYIFSLYHTKKDNTELLLLLEKWRLDYEFHPNLLKIELQIKSQVLDWKGCIEICRYYLSEEPHDEHILVNYAVALYSENSLESNQELKELLPKLRDFEYRSLVHVSTVSNILMRRKHFDDGIELLYRYARLKENSELRKEYFTACVECSQGDKNSGPLKELDEAVEGAFIKYSLNRKIFIIELSEENLKKDFFKSFLGARKSGEIVVKQPLTEVEDVLIIERVMNKYLSLHDEILEQVHSDPHSGIGLTSITFEGGDIQSINETFKSLFGEKGTKRKLSTEEELKKYYALELTFSQIVQSIFDADYISAYHHLVNQNEGLVTIPLIFQDPIIPSDVEFVLDITSLAIFYQLSKIHQFKFDNKFIISKYIVGFLERKLEEQNLESKSELSLSITKENVIPHILREDQKDNNKIYLSGLLIWIKDNCKTEISDRVLDFSRNINVEPYQMPFVNYTLNTVLLVEDQQNRILITDDTQYLKSGLIPLKKMITSEFMAKTIVNENDPALIEFLKNKYQGFTLTAKQLNDEYCKRLTSQDNYYNFCLQNINLFSYPNSALPAIQHVKEIALNQIILPEKFKQDTTAVFVSLLKGVDPAVRNNIELLVKLQCSLLGEKFDLIIEALKDAYFILDQS